MSQKKVLIIDHHDSFSYNLQQYCKYLGARVLVVNAWEISLESVLKEAPTHILFSAGPGSVYEKADIGNSAIILQKFKSLFPILGVCFGHQLIASLEGADIVYTEPFHGKISHLITINPQSQLLQGVREGARVMRYHSMVISESSLEKIEMQGYCITARSKEDNAIMAFENFEKKIFGVQFHPESFATDCGDRILQNFLMQ